jgi:hypothetical protein
MAIYNLYGIDAVGNAARTNIAGCTQVVPANRRLEIWEYGMDHEGTTTAWMWLERTRAAVVADQDALFLAATGSITRQLTTPILGAAADSFTIDYQQAAVIGQISAFWHGRDEHP